MTRGLVEVIVRSRWATVGADGAGGDVSTVGLVTAVAGVGSDLGEIAAVLGESGSTRRRPYVDGVVIAAVVGAWLGWIGNWTEDRSWLTEEVRDVFSGLQADLMRVIGGVA